MIDPKELRIGNWLQGKPFNAPRMGISSNGETQITGEGIAAIERRLITNYSYSPIPLTPEWLERLGFEKDRHGKRGYWWHCKFDYPLVQVGKFAFGIYDYENPSTVMFIGHLEHVHSLQNLFFALTGEEL
jgi:hypothetical protein